MRPEKLVFSGLRSYYGTAEIDFSDLGLFAIIGDTGSGKSTIIEALGLALYARPTWSGQIEGLVSDGASAWQVELTFSVGSNRWRVTRRRGRGASVDKLEQLDGGNEKVDGKSAVTTRVEEVIGLDHAQFTSSVVLPQGRFEKLLTATDADRTKLLTSILGLDDLEATQKKAKDLLDEWTPQVQAWTSLRDDLGPDPGADLERATKEAADAENRARTLTEAVRRLQELQPLVDAARDGHTRLSDLLDGIAERPDDLVDQLVETQRRWAAATTELAEADETLEAARRRVEDLTAAQAERLGSHKTRDDLVGALTEVSRIVEQLPLRQANVDRARVHLGEVTEGAPTEAVDPLLSDAHDKAADEARLAAEALVAANSGLERAEQALYSWREAAGVVSGIEAQLSTTADRIADARRQLEDAERRSADAEDRRSDAAAAVRAALVESAAAQAGEGCSPGDDCPVCARPLPEDYEPPVRHVDVEAAEVAEQGAADAAKAAGSAVQAASLLVERESSTRDRLQADLDSAKEAERGAVTEAATAGVDLALAGAEDDSAVAGPRTAADEARSRSERAALALESASAVLEAARDEIERQLKEHQQRVARAEADLSHAIAAVDELISQLDRIDTPGESGLDPRQRAAGVFASLDATRTALDELDVELKEQVVSERTANEARSRATERAVHERDGAKAALAIASARHQSVAAAYAAATSIAPAVPLGDMPDPPGEVAGPDDLAAECDRLQSSLVALDGVTAALQVRLEELADSRDALEQQLRELISDSGCTTSDELLRDEGAAGVKASEAGREKERCRSAAAKAADLDQKLATARPFLANLRVLHEALRNNRFVGHLVAARQTELLAEASQRLSEITGGRFGFGADFKVINKHSGEQRRSDALSGGERFQAALALALGLMEIASRGSRGRLEAVFIDEGFGSLDGAALEQALDRLRSVSGDGTTVALVSHLRAVAEHVNDVLHVTRDDTTGSRVKKLDPEELERMLDDDVRSGLTA